MNVFGGSSGGIPRLEKAIENAEDRIYVGLSFLLTVFAIAAIWLVEFPPLQDFAYHLVRLHMLLDYQNPALGLADKVTVSFFPTPYILVDYLSLFIGKIFPLLVTGKILLSLYVVLMASSFLYVDHVAHGKYTPAGLAGFVFLFNYFYAMGLISFVFSIPFFLFSFGFWFKHKEQFTAARVLVLALWILGVYLSHPFSFCFLFAIIALITIWYGRVSPRSLLGLVSFVPSVSLLVAALLRDLPKSEINQYIAFVIQDPFGKLQMAFGDGLPYFTAYKPGYEQWIVIAIGLLVLMSQVRLFARKGHAPIANTAAWTAFLLIVIYMVLPDDLLMPNLSLVANRALIFAALILAVTSFVPRALRLRLVLAACFAGLAAAHIGLTLLSYQRINDRYSDIRAALEAVPHAVRLAYWSDWGLSKYGNIYPFAHFNGYYYVEKAGSKIPLLTAFAGPLRSIQFKDQSNRMRNLGDVLSEGCGMVRDSGSVVFVSLQGIVPLQADPERFRCVLTWNTDRIAIYRATDAGAVSPPADISTADSQQFTSGRYYKEGFVDDYDYLLFYGYDSDAQLLERAGCHQRVFVRNNAYLFENKCRESAS